MIFEIFIAVLCGAAVIVAIALFRIVP